MDKIKFSFGETEFITSRMSGMLPDDFTGNGMIKYNDDIRDFEYYVEFDYSEHGGIDFYIYVEPETVDGLPVRVVHEVILKMRKAIIKEYGLE